MGYIKIDTETGETLEEYGNEPTEQPKEEQEIPRPQPTLRKITEKDLHRENERRKRKEGIIGSLTAEELKEIMQRNQIQDLFRRKPEIGQA